MSIQLLMIILGLSGLALGYFLSIFIAKRTVKQPIAIEVEAERKLLNSLLTDPSGYVFVAEIEPEHFADPANEELWVKIQNIFKDVTVPAPEEKEEAFEKASQQITLSLKDELIASAHSTPDSIRLQKHLASLNSEEVAKTRKELLKHAGAVYAAGMDRSTYGGAAVLERGGPDEKLFVRRFAKPSGKRSALITVLFATISALTPLLATLSAPEGTSAWYLATAALFILGAGSLIWALVDYDTMYIDYPSFFALGAVVWALTVASAWADGDFGKLLAGVFMFIAVAITFELGNLYYKIVHGTNGMGFGDTVLALVSIGVPGALTGSWEIGLYSLLAAMISAILGWLVLKLFGKTDLNKPLALIPYLAIGWIFAMTYFLIVGTPVLVTV